jgi:hypothetical protein
LGAIRDRQVVYSFQLERNKRRPGQRKSR